MADDVKLERTIPGVIAKEPRRGEQSFVAVSDVEAKAQWLTWDQMIRALEAAEKMSDAIEAAEDSRYSMTDAGKAAWEFRKAMRGEL